MNTVGNTLDSTNSVLFSLGVFLLCVCTIAALYWTNNAVLLNYLFPFLSIVVGGLLYITRPELYLSFTYWIWFITPFMRRLVDYQMGQFSAISVVMLTPFLVTALSLFSFFRFGMLLKKRLYQPYLFMMAGVMYGFVIGFIKNGAFGAAFNLMEWLCPLLIGFHILVHWRTYPQHRTIVRSTFTLGVLVMGAYGVFQFIMPAPWDTFWMVQSGMTSIGHPEPFRVRVFSTLNAPGPFAMTMMAGLMILFDGRNVISKIAILPGYAGFLLAIVRGAWGGWLLSLLFVITKMSGQMRTRLIGLLVFGCVLVIPLQFFGPASSGAEVVGDRMGTIGKIGEDGSFKHRVAMYQTRAVGFILNPLGEGLGYIGGGSRNEDGKTRNLDSGIIALFVALGWVGTALYITGIVKFLQAVLRNRRWYNDQFAIIVTGVCISYLALMIFANQFISLKGMIIWPLLSLSLCSRTYNEMHHAHR